MSQTRTQFIEDLEKLFQLALAEKSFQTAYKTKELLGKEAGWISSGANLKKTNKAFDVTKLKENELNAMIQHLEHQLNFLNVQCD